MPHRSNDDSDDDVLGRPLTREERKTLRRMMENEERIQWFWGSVRVWAGWISAAIIGAWAVVEIGTKIWKRTL
jgi:hypothetical protein